MASLMYITSVDEDGFDWSLLVRASTPAEAVSLWAAHFALESYSEDIFVRDLAHAENSGPGVVDWGDVPIVLKQAGLDQED